LVWLIFPTAYSFLMISPNLHDIWVVFFLNLSQELKFFLLLYFGTLGDGYSLKGSKKKPSWHTIISVGMSVQDTLLTMFIIFPSSNECKAYLTLAPFTVVSAYI
jgi:hypothetical protein